MNKYLLAAIPHGARLTINFILFAILLMATPINAAEIVEFVTPTKNSSPSDLAFDKQGNLWFTEVHGNKIAKLTPSRTKPGTSNGIVEYELPTPNSKPWYLLISKSGDIWFSAWGANIIGKINSQTGKITEFPIPTPKSEPHKLVEHSDGSIWFTEFETNKIGQLNPATGKIQEFKINPGHPHGIALKDGKVWYTQAGKFWKKKFFNKLASLDPQTGQIKEIAIQPKNSVPHAMRLSADGNIWFAQFFGKKLSRLDFSSGNSPAIITYSLGKDGGTPHDFMFDESHNAIWYADNHGDRIGRLDLTKAQPGTSNGVETFNIPTPGAQAGAVALDAEGNVWFAEMGMYFRGKYQSKIGKLTP